MIFISTEIFKFLRSSLRKYRIALRRNFEEKTEDVLNAHYFGNIKYYPGTFLIGKNFFYYEKLSKDKKDK